MAQHSNYAKDRDLMMEAYSSVQGNVPKTASTALPRGYVLTEAHCDEESLESVELGGDLYEVGAPDPSNESELVISIVKHANGYMITTGQFSSPEDFVTKGPDSAIEAGGYALTLDGKLMDEDDLEDGLGHEDNERAEGADYVAPHEDAEGGAKFTLQGVGGMHGQTLAGDSQSFNSLEEVCKAAGISIQDCISNQWDDMGDGTKEFQVDEDNVIVMHAPSEDGSCASHEDAEDNEGSLKNEVLAAIKAKATEYGGNKGAMAHAAQELAAEYEQAGEAEKASIAKNQGAVFATFR